MHNRLTISINKNSSLLRQLRDQGYFIPAYCGGRGSCGKCRVRFSEHLPDATETERQMLSADELAAGWRLACRVFAEGTCVLEIPEYAIENVATADTLAKEYPAIGNPGDNRYALAIDIGTSTIAASLIDVMNRETVKTVTGINHQIAYGADVLSRIDASNRGEGRKLQELLFSDLGDLCRQLGIGENVKTLPMPVVIAGNTTMQHLLQGLSCRGLGVFPFTPVDISMHLYKNMTILPGIGTYVGAEIVSGIVACGINQKEDISMLVDLGTNGEMVIGNKDRILVASAAAGPAFEGGSISCGSPGVPGAIDTVTIEHGKTSITTIGGEKASGICGSGVLDTVYELRKEEIIDESGMLKEEYLEGGFPLAPGITFTAKDVSEVQLAKAAIRAGIEILLQSYGITYNQVSRLYLAGGFGQKMDCDKAVGIGMLPKELRSRITAAGNSSLEGAKKLAMESSLAKSFRHAVRISEEIVLSNQKMFQELYVKYMYFHY